MFIRSLRSNYPQLCKGREIIVIDCNQFHDPEKDKGDVKRHRGTHWKIQSGVMDDRRFEEIMDPLRRFNSIPEGRRKLIVCVCRSGRHRSEAVRSAVHTTLCYDYYDVQPDSGGISTIQLQAGDRWNHICTQGRCSECDYDAWMHKRVPNNTPIQWISSMATWCDRRRQRIRDLIGLPPGTITARRSPVPDLSLIHI